MHEYSIARALVEQATSAARRGTDGRVTRVRCRVGVLRQVDRDMLLDAFEIAAEGSACAGATLVVQTAWPRTWCEPCAREFEVRNWSWNCPVCGRAARGAHGGDELELETIDVECREQPCPAGGVT
ncbi:MAG: hydrogenase maturation nickel metallochaperone HypA [Phycisphaerae bacterium]